MPASVHDARQAGTLHGGGLRGGKQVSTKAALRSSFQGRGSKSRLAWRCPLGPARVPYSILEAGVIKPGARAAWGYRKQGAVPPNTFCRDNCRGRLPVPPDSRHSPSGRRVRLLPLRRKTTATMKKLPL
jgi:hypothetical protein